MSNVESVSKFVIHELRKLERDLLEERESGVGGVSVEHQIMMLVDHEEVFWLMKNPQFVQVLLSDNLILFVVVSLDNCRDLMSNPSFKTFH